VLAAHAQVLSGFAEPRPPVTLARYGQSDGDPPAAFSRDPQVALVEASVMAARNRMPVPNPLRPAALDLGDRVAADLGECRYWGLPDPMPLCPRGDPAGDRTLVLLGDSHAQHWIPALEPLARRHGYRAYFLVYPACTPALVMPWSPLKEAPDRDCVAFHEWSQQQIERLRPDVVVMSTDEQPSYFDAEGRRVRSDAGVATLVGDGMAARVAALRPLTDRVVVLGDPPRLTVDPETALDGRGTLADGLGPPAPRSLLMRRAVREAARSSGAEYVETAQWFCAYGACPLVVGDRITRRDRGHITLEYSASLSDQLDARLGLSAGAVREGSGRSSSGEARG
jgi:SGNH domain (fused to AT3 domains)